ncbi:cupin domain-containing protein [Kitasatospora sp. NPDC059811]|uniref:cupin domain-containing protein n=1 Tax=Streptomycetaceae TaxID=2062 RepID=UPI0007AEF8BD|nr:cupin domain-containing protein [Streptomyces sp. MJM8645]
MPDTASWAARLGGDQFLARTLHRSHLVIPGDPADVAGLLSWDDLNSILSTHRLEPPRLRLSADGETLPAHRYATATTNRRAATWHRLQPADLHARLAEGASLVLDAIDEIHPPIRSAAEDLERFVGTPVQANAYASWTKREGFGTHWDDHDVVVVQLDGAKRWRLYGPTRTAPTWRDVEAPAEPTGEPIADLVLTAGDMLYLPRGWWHAVTADQGSESLHLTFGLVSHTGADLLGWVVDLLRADAALRLDVPRFAPADDQAAYVSALRRAVVSELDDPELLARWAESLDTTHGGRQAPSLPFVIGLPTPRSEDDETITRRVKVVLTAPRARLTRNQTTGTVTLAGAGTAWDFKDTVAPALGLLLNGGPVGVGEFADAAGIRVTDAATLLSELLAGQAVRVVETGR